MVSFSFRKSVCISSNIIKGIDKKPCEIRDLLLLVQTYYERSSLVYLCINSLLSFIAAFLWSGSEPANFNEYSVMCRSNLSCINLLYFTSMLLNSSIENLSISSFQTL